MRCLRVPVGCLWGAYRVPVECLWGACGVPVGCLWSMKIHGLQCRLLRTELPWYTFQPFYLQTFSARYKINLQTFSACYEINLQSFTAIFFTPHRKKSSSAVLDPGFVSWLVGQLRLLRFCPWCYKTIGQGYIHTSRSPQHVLWRRLLFWWERSGVFSLLKDGIQALIQWVDDFKH